MLRNGPPDIFGARQRELKAAYNACFETEAGRKVLADLHDFCHAAQPTFHPDAHVAAFNEGQRRVWLRITAMMKLTGDDIARLVADHAMNPNQGADDGD